MNSSPFVGYNNKKCNPICKNSDEFFVCLGFVNILIFSFSHIFDK